MNYKTYLDKVYGCWLGKCICGSIGAPLEGCKQLFDYQFKPEFWRLTLPNDDLELQILWLNVIEKIGLDFDSDDLADAFLENVTYNPGEYASFKRNYRRGIHPPTSGSYNNFYYHEGMGCCIRAEIWACLAAGDPALAARICRLDGQLDHTEESIHSECFIAALEAAAFRENDLERSLECAGNIIPADSKLARLINDVCRWCDEKQDWREVRTLIIRHYGHPDCTNMFQNIGITLMALKMSGGDLERATVIALNSGYDTDCTCGIAGAVLGILAGAEKLQRTFGLSDTGFVTTFDVHRPSDRIERLANDVARLAAEVERVWHRAFPICDLPPEVAEFRLPVRKRRFRFESGYDGLPVVEAGGEIRSTLTIHNLSEKAFRGILNLASDTLNLQYDANIAIAAGGSVSVPVLCRHPDSGRITDTNLIQAELDGAVYQWGIAAAVTYHVYGPFFGNFDDIPQIDLCGPPYGTLLPQGEFINRFTALRNYHLNSRAGLDIAGLDEQALISGTLETPPDGSIVAWDDLIPIDSAFGYQGPAVFYLTLQFSTPETMRMPISIGHSGPVRFWLDGRELVRSNLETWHTPENLNLEPVDLCAGKHLAVCKVVRNGGAVKLSIHYKNSFRPSESPDAPCTNFTFYR